MADLHPTELGCTFQGGMAPEGRPAHVAQSASTLPPDPVPVLSKDVLHLLQPKRLRADMRRLRYVMRHLRRVEMLLTMCMAEQAAQRAQAAKAARTERAKQAAKAEQTAPVLQAAKENAAIPQPFCRPWRQCCKRLCGAFRKRKLCGF